MNLYRRDQRRPGWIYGLAALTLATLAAAQELTPAGPLLAMLEQSDGWTSLFNGNDLDGWEGDLDGYRAEGGSLVCTQSGNNLYTSQTYSDFALAFEFKLSPGANNGLGIRSPRTGNPAYEGMELQILDDGAPEYENLQLWQFHGSVYGVAPAARGHLKPTGEWNQQVVIAIGPFIKVILNGATIVDVDLRETEPIDGNPHPGLHRPGGHLVLFGHGSLVAFRNLRLRDFAEDAGPAAEAPTPPPGFVPLFNGQDLAGWKGLVGNPKLRRTMTPGELAEAQATADQAMQAHWSAVDGVLVFDGHGDNICTDRDYGNFELLVDWRIPATADSGIYLRGSPQIQIWDPGNQAQWQHGARQGSGALWNNRTAGHRPLVRADRPIGEWNTFFIRMNGDRVTVELNGLRVLDRVVMDNYWEPERPMYAIGPIELQNHGSPLYFRNLFIRETGDAP